MLNKKLFMIAALPLAVACGGQKAAPQKLDTAAATTDRASSQKYAPATMDVTAEGKTETGLFIGVVNEPVMWTFTGLAAEPGRDVAVLLNKIPQGATIDPPQDGTSASTTVRVVWTPGTAQASGENMEIYARDLTRCKATEAKPENCYAAKPLKKYDAMIAGAKWEIVKPEAVQPAAEDTAVAADSAASGDDPNAAAKARAADCAAAAQAKKKQIQGMVLQTGLQVLTGGGLQALIPGLLGGAINSGMIGGGGQQPKC